MPPLVTSSSTVPPGPATTVDVGGATVTFGVLPDRSNQPPMIDPGKGCSAITGAPCVGTQPVAASTTICPGTPAAAVAAYAGGPRVPPGSDYAGGVAVSGIFAGSPFHADGFSLSFTKPGTYTYLCAVHLGMAGVVQVM